MKKLIILTILPFFTFSQKDWEKVEATVFMEVIREYEKTIPENQHYSIETGYKIYKHFTDEQHSQSFDGKLICRAGKELNVYQMGHIMIQGTDYNVTIDTASNQLMVQKPDISFYHRKTVSDYAGLSEISETVYRKEMKGKTVYMLEFKKGYAYRAMEFVFTEKNSISQIVIYSTQPYYTEGDVQSDDQAKIELNFKNFRTGKAVDFSSFIEVKDCISIKENEIIPIGKYKDYELIDLRN